MGDIMDAMRESWTDRRLDDLSSKVDRGFDRIDAELRSQRLELGALRAETKASFEGMEERFDARFDSLHRVLIQLGGLLTAALIGLIATQL
jgi:hypothetical protein